MPLGCLTNCLPFLVPSLLALVVAAYSWGDRALTSIELDDYIATAAEKTPTDDQNISELRHAIQLVKQ